MVYSINAVIELTTNKENTTLFFFFMSFCETNRIFNKIYILILIGNLHVDFCVWFKQLLLNIILFLYSLDQHHDGIGAAVSAT